VSYEEALHQNHVWEVWEMTLLTVSTRDAIPEYGREKVVTLISTIRSNSTTCDADVIGSFVNASDSRGGHCDSPGTEKT
jgi:hypothetical protein